MYGDRKGICRSWVGKPAGKRPLGRHSCKWEDNVKMDLQEVECGRIDWIKLDQDTEKWWAHMNVVIYFRVP